MKNKLIIKLIAVFLLFIVLNWLIRIIFDPSFCYGNEVLHQKLEDYEKTPQRYNTIMIGSSCIFWNLDTDQFDSLMPAEWKVCSYNFGSNGTTPPETYDFLDKLLKRHKGSIDRVIIELRDVSLFEDHHLKTLQKRYYLTPQWLLFFFYSNLNKSTIPKKDRIKNMSRNSIAFLERWTNAGYFNDIYGKPLNIKQQTKRRHEALKRKNVRGFLSFTKLKKGIHDDRFIEDTTVLYKNAEKFRIIRQSAEPIKPNKANISQISRIIEKCDRNGIHCVFLLHPKQPYISVYEAKALVSKIPQQYLIDLSDPDLYPELYLAANSYNRYHFNVSGTRIFTNLVALNFNAIHTVWLENRLKPETTGRKHL